VNPQRLGSRYLLHDRLGQGAMGVVWRGQDLETGAWVAIKLLRPDYAGSPAAVARFVGERNALVRFRHPNVVNLRDMIVEGDRLALVMDLITGGDLDIFRQHNGGTLAPVVAVKVTAQICEGLAAAHAAGIVHRDLKPSNVLLQAGQVKLADFGISRIAGEARRTTTGTVMGTPTYLAPEAINGEEPTAACDIYAVGITLYELLTSQPPFDGHVVAVMQAHLQREPERIAGISDRLWELIAACLSKDQAGRPTASDLARSLTALEENTGASTLGPGPRQAVLAAPTTRAVQQLSHPTSAEQPPAQSPRPASSLTMLAPTPGLPPGGQLGGPPGGPGGAGPLAGLAPWHRQRKRLLAGAAALVAVIAAVAVVYAVGLSGHSTAPLTGGGLTKPTVGAVTSSAPAPARSHPGAHHTHGGGRIANPTPGSSITSVKQSQPAGHPHSSPTAPVTVRASSSSSSSSKPTSTPSSSPTLTPPPPGVWQCSPATVVNGTGANASMLSACIRVEDGQLQVQGRLTNVPGAKKQIELALDGVGSAAGIYQTFTSPDCATGAVLCIYTSPLINPGYGDWDVLPGWESAGTYQGSGAPSPTIAFSAS
jgi:serine/threonine-protein kinase